MKKWLSVLLSVMLCVAIMLTLVACGSEDTEKKDNEDADAEAEVTTTVADPTTTKAEETTTTTVAPPVDEPDEPVDEPDEPVDEPDEPVDEPDADPNSLLVGEWYGVGEMGDMLEETYAAMGLEVELGEFSFGCTYTFTDDDTMQISLDVDMFRDQAGDLVEAIAEASGMTVEEMCAEENITEEEMIDSVVEGFTSTMAPEADYEFDGESTLTVDYGADLGSVDMKVTLDGDTLTLDNGIIVLELERQ